MQPMYSSPPPPLWLFQSSSGQKAGCNRSKTVIARNGQHMFQSSSGQKAGCNRDLFGPVLGCD